MFFLGDLYRENILLFETDDELCDSAAYAELDMTVTTAFAPELHDINVPVTATFSAGYERSIFSGKTKIDDAPFQDVIIDLHVNKSGEIETSTIQFSTSVSSGNGKDADSSQELKSCSSTNVESSAE